MILRFDARHIGSGVWGIFDVGVMGWRATYLSENEAHQQAAELNVIFNQYGQRNEEDRREVNPPIEVEPATWSVGGSSTTGSRNAGSGGAGRVAKCGSKPLIFGPRKRADHRELLLYVMRRTPAQRRNRLSLWPPRLHPAYAVGRA
jgi:hypothetical protein